MPTIQVMVKRVRSRKPSSRLSAGSGMLLALRAEAAHFLAQLFGDATQTFLEELRLAAQPDAEESLQSHVRAGHDQHALVDADPLAKIVARRGRVVAHQAKCAGPRLAEGEEAAEAIHPLAHDRQNVMQNATS